MAQPNKIILFITFLLLNGVIVSCDSCKSEKEKLEQEEKVLMEKLKKQVKPEAWEKVEQGIKNDKGNKQKIEDAINTFTEMLKDIDEIEKGRQPSAQEKIGIRPFLQMLIDSSADAKKNFALVKQFVTDLLALLQNFKKQAALKN